MIWEMACRLPIRILAAVIAILAVALGWAREPQTQNSNRWEGYLIDLSCARERKDKEPGLGATHSKKCLTMPACDRSGFGLLTATNEVLRFDEPGNRKTRSLIGKATKDANFSIIVRGTRLGDVLAVRQIELR